MKKRTILIVEDTEITRRELRRSFEIDDVLKEFEILEAENFEEYYKIQKEKNPDVLIIDMRLADSSGLLDLKPEGELQVLRRLAGSSGLLNSEPEGGLQVLSLYEHFRRKNRASVAIVFTAFPRVEDCVFAMRCGVWDYINKSQEGAYTKLVQSIKEGLKHHFSDTAGPNSDWLEENLPQLTEDYGGQWVAFVDAQPVDSNKEYRTLKKRVQEKYGGQSPYFCYVPKEL